MAALALAAAGLALSWAAGSALTRGRPAEVAAAPAPACDLRLRARDGTSLAATYWPGRAPASAGVLILHGVHASRTANVPNAAWLHKLGYAVLTPDFRGHGQSDAASTSFGLREADDAAAAFAWLKQEQRGAPIAVIGISMGGAAALLGEAGPLRADALVLQAVYADIRHAIRNRIAAVLGPWPAALLEPLLSYQSVPRFEGPVLVIGGAQDRYATPEEAALFHTAAKGPKRLWLRLTGDHAEVCGASDPAYREAVASFLREAMPAP